MKNVTKIIGLLLLVVGFTFGATVTAVPSQVPIGAYVNGSDGDQQFIQSLNITLADDGSGTWVAGNDIVVTLPAAIRLADCDGDGTLTDGVSVSHTETTALTVTVNAATAGTITLDLAAADDVTAGDIISIIFPITTSSTAAADSTVDYTITYGTDDPEAEDTVTVTFKSVLTLVTFGADYSGGDESSDKGDVYPAVAGAVTAALPDFITDQSSGDVDAFVNGADAAFESFTLDNSDVTDEISFYVWASQTDSLTKIDNETNPTSHIPIDDGDGEPVDTANEDDTFAATQLDGELLAEGTWYFYITSSVTADWVLGWSDSVAVKHYPVFATSPSGGGVDYDADGVFEPGDGTDDDVSAIYLESGGTQSKDGDLDADAGNIDNVNIHWSVEDVDDNAEVHVYISTTDGLTSTDLSVTGGVIDSLAGATKIHTSSLYEDGTGLLNYDIYTDAATYETAGDYYIYLVANDTKHQAVYQCANNAGTDLTMYVKHYPYLKIQDHYGEAKALNTATEQYYVINWGETIDGDKDADGNAVIKFYASDLNYALSGCPSTPATLANDATTDPDGTVLITTTNEDDDDPEDNRYMWNIKDSGLAAGTYYIYGHISQGGDDLVVQYKLDGLWYSDTDNDRAITLSHDSYFLPLAPATGDTLEVKNSDRLTLQWDAYDLDATTTDIAVHAFIAPNNTESDSYTDLNDAEDKVGYYALTTSNNGDDLNSSVAYPTEYLVLDITDLTSDMADTAVDPSGDYYVYYYYSVDGTFDAETPNLAPGIVRIGLTDEAETGFELSPNVMLASKGDTLTIDVYANDGGGGGTNDAQLLSIFLDVPAAYFSVVDQSSSSGTQPFLNETTNFDGTVTYNAVTESSGTYQLDFVEYASGGDAIATRLKVATFELVVDSLPTAQSFTTNSITFGTTGTRATKINDEDGDDLAVTTPTTAATISLARGGIISGSIDLEGRTDENQTVSISVCPVGSFDNITDSDFLTANSGTSGSALTETLGASGAYSLTMVPPGKYRVVVNKDGYLDEVSSTITVNANSSTTLNFTGGDVLLAGDCAGYTDSTGNALPDNQIGTADTDAISTAFGTSSGDGSWNAYADVDGSGTVWVEDLNYAATNTGNGESVLYKNLYEPNDETIVDLVKIDQSANYVTYAVALSKLGEVHAYAAEIEYDNSQWGFVDRYDALSEYAPAINFGRTRNYGTVFVSALVGQDILQTSEIDIVTFTLEALVPNPVEPTIKEVTLIDSEHNVTYVNANNANDVSPNAFTLEQNYPNPFNPVTNIEFTMPAENFVTLTVYDLTGREVKTLISGFVTAGTYTAIWDSRDHNGLKVSSGMYFYSLSVDNEIVANQKMILMK